MTDTTSRDFLRGYAEAAIWASTDDEGTPLDRRYTVADLSADARRAMAADCADFLGTEDVRAALAVYLTAFSAEQAGHDFWLTRNGHGAGFWDRDFSGGPLTEACTALADAARPYGEAYILTGERAGDDLEHYPPASDAEDAR